MLRREFDGSLLLQLDGSDTVYNSWVETLCFNYDFLPVGEEIRLIPCLDEYVKEMMLGWFEE